MVLTPAITSLIDKVDSFELVRDQVAAILAVELANQVRIASASGRDARSYCARVYTERTNPWSDFVDLPDTLENPEHGHPVVNVSFERATYDASASNVVERQRANATFNIDCYAYGVAHDDGGMGHCSGDQIAVESAQAVVRVVRNILMSGQWAYLGMRGSVSRRWVNSIQAFQPAQDGRQIQQVAALRIELQVDFNEFSPQVAGQLLDAITATVRRDGDGRVYLVAEYGET